MKAILDIETKEVENLIFLLSSHPWIHLRLHYQNNEKVVLPGEMMYQNTPQSS